MRQTSGATTYGTEGRVEGLGVKALIFVCSAKAFQGGPKFLARIAAAVALLIVLTCLWSLRLSGIEFGSRYLRVLKWRPEELGDGSVGGGLRIVVFGGGDVATPNRQVGGQVAAWTESLCEQLQCKPYLSFVPEADTTGGAVISKSLFESSLDRVSRAADRSTNGSGTPKLDYSWVSEYYPVPSHRDLTSQIDAFLSMSRPQNPPHETLWILNVGFWDIWYLAALPRGLAIDVMDSQVRHFFERVEVLYEEAQKNGSVAFSDYYADTTTLTEKILAGEGALPRAPFRIFIPKLFDISLTPGFATVRLEPPLPHTRAEQMRNAAFLTRYWNTVVQDTVDAWLDLPGPEDWSGEDAIDVDVVKNVVAKRSDINDLQGRAPGIEGLYKPPPRREAVTYDISRHLRELIIDRQLRDVDIVDQNGLGSRPTQEGFEEVRQPCTSLFGLDYGSERVIEHGQGDNEIRGAVDLCVAPGEHLFWDEFTVNQRAIDQIGRRAAEQFKRQAVVDAQWLQKAQRPRPSMRFGEKGVELKATAFQA